MNREQAIQEQMDQIMDLFDFAAAVAVLDVYRSLNCGYPKDWTDNGEFKQYLLRTAARDCMKAAIKEGFAGHSYFSSYLHEGENHEGPWVKLELFFGDRTYNDGVSYEK